jgi:hypothetical protein
MSEKEDAKVAADVKKALDALEAALKAASDAGMKTYVHGDGSFEECDLIVEVAREYTF